MSINGNLQAFSREDIGQVPDEPGVYGLYQGDDLIYIGRAEGGLSIMAMRARLKSHCERYRGPNTEHPTHYRCEES
jgi:excinuclease UvrABC nuclease subunit